MAHANLEYPSRSAATSRQQLAIPDGDIFRPTSRSRSRNRDYSRPSSRGTGRSRSLSPAPSRLETVSLYPNGELQSSSMLELGDVKSEVMCNWLYQSQMEKMWSSNGEEEGVILRKTRDEYTCCPKDLAIRSDGIFNAVCRLNVRCAITVNTRIIKLFLARVDVAYIPLRNGLRLQIVPYVVDLPHCHKHHFAAFIQDSGFLVVWDDDPNHLLQRVQDIEDQLMGMIWKELNDADEKAENETGSQSDEEEYDDPDEALSEAPRKIVLIQSVITAITLILLFAALGSGWRKIAIEIKIDRSWTRLAFLVAAPFQCWLALFFMQALGGGVFQIIGPISQMNINTKFFSGLPPRRLRGTILPHVTIQCPVYKEGLWSVIDPTVKSIKAAISTYEMQGGTANIFINDDGMQLVSPEDARERRIYYEEHDIGWVARPKHNPKPSNGEQMFIRAGKFKKASNMNYALDISARVEEKLVNMKPGSTWSQDQEEHEYDLALSRVIEEDEGRTWAEGNIRVGDYILLIDSDTRVPVDCFLDAVSEMERSPQVAIIQFSSGVMNVTTSWFEQGITFFTNLVYTAIQYAVANGDVAPFVGHNAFLRWSAIQDVAYMAEDGVTEKYWSEATVSEDFDLAIRLQTIGYIIRLAAYAGQGFKEGVSLTVYDELARWEKYAYGCSELIFHPFAEWIFKGPFTPLFRGFISGGMPLTSKITIMAYVGTYFAIATAWILTLMNYFLIGWFNGSLDHYYLDSFKVYFAIILVFTALGNLALAILRYRIEERSLGSALFENFTWIFMMTLFFGGISLHVSQAILCHLFSVDMTWGATSKEASDTTFFKELPVIAKKFRLTFAWCFFQTATMVVLAGVGPVGKLVPHDWKIRFFTAVWPLGTVVVSHGLLPLFLNPGLMTFTF